MTRLKNATARKPRLVAMMPCVVYETSPRPDKVLMRMNKTMIASDVFRKSKARLWLRRFSLNMVVVGEACLDSWLVGCADNGEDVVAVVEQGC